MAGCSVFETNLVGGRRKYNDKAAAKARIIKLVSKGDLDSGKREFNLKPALVLTYFRTLMPKGECY